MGAASHSALLRHPGHLLALGLGTGLVPLAPGTVGSIAAAAIWIGLYYLDVQPWLLGAATLIGAIAGVPLCSACARAMHQKDPSAIVWDEWIGTWIALLIVPPEPLWWLAALALFRVLDIVKPWPVCLADRHLRGGLGIMLDDVLAGAFAGAIALGTSGGDALLQ